MAEDIFFKLLSRQLAGEATEKELQQLKKMIDADPELKKVYLSFHATESEISEEELSKAEQAFALHSLKMHLHVPAAPARHLGKGKNRQRILLASAALLLIFTIFMLLFSPFGSNTALKSQVVTKKGSKTMVKLPDGSSVWVNADSRLQYADNFKGKLREVWLDGEAFFDVKKDPAHPFIIHTDKINIKVLGTAFNVKSYPKDQVIETSLIRGRIEVSFNDRPSENIILRPNEKLTVRKDQSEPDNAEAENTPKIKLDNLLRLNAQNQVVETAWMDNKIAFSNCPMSDIAVMLERRFDINVEFKDQEVMKYRYTGIFNDESINDILKIMKITKPFNYKLNGKKLTITN
ncbi:FecR family protein [Pedobacter africanus]|uniref:FecR family protein n=1 Tax=Pedobacter africanus TaxID=151894 RepID=A0A1W2AGA7_9SPHI|nr:FecR family protein [Pedobacter africanus]SMC59749.1 FecR family protein [Pedobacter africanus]